jgi:acyl-CoA synthetase (AMP-forming)/AMP-acid ligase II
MNHEYTSAIAIDGNSIICSWLPLYHDMGFITSFLMNIANCTFSCLIDPIDWINRPSILVQHASSVKATHIWMPNFAFQVMARIASRLEGLLDLSHVKYWTNCSEPITVTAMTEFLHAYRPHGIAVTNLAGCYGMAECVFAVTHKTYDEQSLITGAIDGRLSSGSPLGGTKVEIFKDANSDDFGMIRIHSPWMMEGYLNQTDANTFTKEWIQTNDIGMIVNKELYVIGRTNEWINVAGVKYDCRSIEDKLNSECDIYPGRVILTSIHHKNIGTNTPIVLCESKAGTNVNVLVQSIRNTLWSNYGLSVSKIIVKSKGFIVKTTSGKISRDETIRKLMIDLDVSGEITNREAAPIK